MEQIPRGCLVGVGLVLVYAIVWCQGQTTQQSIDGIRCRNGSECPAEMCCVHNPLSKPDSRKRFLFEEYEQHDHGYCRRVRRYNESCWPLGHHAANPALYEFFCPCEVGMECRGLVVHETAHQLVHKNPKCQDPEANLIDSMISATGQACVTDTDCPAGTCCVQHPLTSNRRQQSHGYCRNEKRLNETCSMSFVDPNTHDFQCGCEAGLECRGKHVHHFDDGHSEVHENPMCQKPLQ